MTPAANANVKKNARAKLKTVFAASALRGKTVVVSAAAEGIGKTVAIACARAGARVFASDINEKAIAQLRAKKIPRLHIGFANAACEKSVREHIAAVCKHSGGVLHGLVNNVGIAGPTAAVENIAAEEWRAVMEANIGGHFYFAKHCAPPMKKQGGCIINISSTAGLFGFPMRAPYAASKWAAVGLAKTLAMELGAKNIRVNAVCPGSVDGERMRRVIAAKAKETGRAQKEVRADFAAMASMRAFVRAEDIANLAVFLLSDAAKNISGQAIAVDGNTERTD